MGAVETRWNRGESVPHGKQDQERVRALRGAVSASLALARPRLIRVGLGAHFTAEKRARMIRRFHRYEVCISGKGSGLRSCGDARTEAAKCAHIFLVLFAVGNGRALRVGCSL